MEPGLCASHNWTEGQPCNDTAMSVFSEMSSRILQLTIVFVGMPISGFTSFVIITSRQLWEPRHLALLPLIIFHILLFVQSTLYYLASVHQWSFCCRVFTIFYGVPYMLVDLSYVLIVIERYMAICHPSTHQRWANKWTLSILLAIYLAITLAICTAQWFLLGSQDPCSYQYVKLTPYLSMIHFGLFCVFVFFQVHIVVKLRTLLRMYPSLKKIHRKAVVFRSNRSAQRSSTTHGEGNLSALTSYFCNDSTPEANVSTVRTSATGRLHNCEISSFGQYLSAICQRHLNRMEVQVTISVAVVSFPQLIFCLPYAGGLSLSFFVYLYFYDLESYFQLCIRVQQYFQAAYLMYVICFPLVYVALNREFRQAVKRKFLRDKSPCQRSTAASL